MENILNILLADFDQREHLYLNFYKKYHTKANIFKGLALEKLDSHTIDIMLVTHELFFNCPQYIQYAKENKIPTLLLMDGMIEWRNSWEHPITKTTDVPTLYQPIACDKVACIGENQVNILEDWGNYGKCEDVGYPSYDHLVSPASANSLSKNDPVNIFITSSYTPYFNQEQKKLITRSYLDLRKYFDEHESIDGKKIIVNWRLSNHFSNETKLNEYIVDFKSVPIWQQMNQADIVISTPSTIMLAAIILKKPFVMIDYTCSPLYFTPTWYINSSNKIHRTMIDAINPSEEKQLHQTFFLNNNLSNIGSASDKLFELIIKQVDEFNGKLQKQVYLIKNSRLDRIDLKNDFIKLQNEENEFNLASKKFQLILEIKRLKSIAKKLNTSIDQLKSSIGRLESTVDQLKTSSKSLKNNLEKSKLEINNILNSISYRVGYSLLQPVRFLKKLLRIK